MLLNNSLKFNTVEEGFAKIKELRKLQSKMVGFLYPSVIEDEIIAVQERIHDIKSGKFQPFEQTEKKSDEKINGVKTDEVKIDEVKSIDWEQRRYEIAKEAVTAIMSNEDFCAQVLYEGAQHGQRQIQINIAHAAVVFADALIEELKR
jgi:hypothetical protein